MKVSFRTKYRDLIAFNFHIYSRSLIILGMLVVILIIGIKPNWRAVIQTAPDKSLLFQMVLFACLELFPVAIMYIILALCLLLANISKKFKTVYTDETITLGDDVIISESAYSCSEIQWTAVQVLVQTRSHIFMYGAQRRNLIIPKRAFDSDEACEEFWRACQAKVKASPHRN